MPFLSLSFNNFRNINNDTIDLLSREIYFVGKNGQGKSNILEALYISAYGASYRTRNENELILNGETNYSIRALFKDQRDHTNTISVVYKENKKKIEKNAKQIYDRKELINTIPCVLFSHEDLDFAIGTPERKRFFIDQSLSMYDETYIDKIRNFKKILLTRNLVLKNKQIKLLDVLDIQFAECGIEVVKKRNETIRDFNKVFTRLYKEVSDIDNVYIDYSSSWKTETIEKILISLIEKRDLDLAMGTSMTGPHRDRIRYFRDKDLFISKASTGQKRLLALLLRTAQACFYTEVTGRLPVLLMDDVMLELDPEKRQKFTKVLPEYEQLFCTFLPEEPFERYKKSTTKVYNIDGGKWSDNRL